MVSHEAGHYLTSAGRLARAINGPTMQPATPPPATGVRAPVLVLGRSKKMAARQRAETADAGWQQGRHRTTPPDRPSSPIRASSRALTFRAMVLT